VCFSASANFIGSAVLGAIEVGTLAEVKRRYEFTSIWCAYAAVVSVIIYFFFRRSRTDRPAKYALGAAA
jgi:hypothetical protein